MPFCPRKGILILTHQVHKTGCPSQCPECKADYYGKPKYPALPQR
jgi:predicted Zn-ribbon and HTH transcriptional regulator